MKNISVHLLMGLVIFVLVFILLMLCPWFNVTDTQINGLDNLKEDKILSVLSLDNKKTNIFAFSTIKAKKILKKDAYVEDVSIKRVLPNKLVFDIKERKIRGYVPYLNSFLYIDSDGRVLDVQSSYVKKLPLVVGLKFKEFNLGEILQTENEVSFNIVVEMSKLMTKYELLEDVIKVDVSKADDVHLYINNVDVKIGQFKDSNWKISTLNEIIKKLKPEDKGFLYLDNPNKAPRFEYLT